MGSLRLSLRYCIHRSYAVILQSAILVKKRQFIRRAVQRLSLQRD